VDFHDEPVTGWMRSARTAKRREPVEKAVGKTAENSGRKRCGRNAAGCAQKRWTKKSPLL
jgi:hypothetical protein